MRRNVCLFVAWLCATTVVADEPAAKADRSQAYYHYMVARRALSMNDYARAISELKNARDADPASVLLRAELADVYARLYRFSDAIREAEAALIVAPTDPELLVLLATSYQGAGDLERAVAALTKLVDAHPEEPAYVAQLATLLDKADRTEEAMAALERAVRKDPRATAAVFELVERFRAVGHLDRAIAMLEEAARANPGSVALQAKLAEIHLQARDQQAAARALARMVELEPDNEQVIRDVAAAYQQMGRTGQAARLYGKLLEIRPEDRSARFGLATTLAGRGDAAGALVQFRMLLSQSDGDPTERFELLKRIGWLENQLGHRQASLAALQEAEPLAAADDLDFVALLAREYDLVGQPEQALRLWRRHPSADQDGAVMAKVGQAVYLILTGEVAAGRELYREQVAKGQLTVRQHGWVAHALLRRGESAAAREALREAVRMFPTEEARIYQYVVDLLLESDAIDPGIELMSSLVERYPDDRDLHVQLSRYLNQVGRSEAALSTLEKAGALFPEDANIQFVLGAALERQNRLDDAERALERAIDLSERHADALNYLAYTWAENDRNLEKSLAYARRAVELEPHNGAFLDTLGWACFKSGRLEDARRYLQLAVAQLGDDPVVREHLGDVLVALGDEDGALREYREAVRRAAGDTLGALQTKIDALVRTVPEVR